MHDLQRWFDTTPTSRSDKALRKCPAAEPDLARSAEARAPRGDPRVSRELGRTAGYCSPGAESRGGTRVELLLCRWDRKMPRVAGVCIPALLVLHVVEDVVSNVCTGGDVNGCTVNLPLGLYKKSFTPSCNKHDVCYMCVGTFIYALCVCVCVCYLQVLIHTLFLCVCACYVWT